MFSAAIFSGDDGLPHIERCLKSLQPIAPEIVFVDTSTSRKITELVKKYTSNIYHEPWRNDFSYHRTHSFGLCTGKWILQIDADEELIFEDATDGPTFFLANINQADKKIDGISLALKDWRESKQKFMGETDLVRIFRRGNVKWKRRVHNVWEYPGETVTIRGVHLKHYGYDLTTEQSAAKAKRTIPLLHQSIEDDKTDYDCYFYLAQAYAGYENNAEKALKYCETYMAYKEQIGKDFNTNIYHLAIFIHMKNKNYDKVQEIIKEALGTDSYDLDILYDWLNLGVIKKDPKIIAIASQRFVFVFENLPTIRQKTHGRFYFNYNLKSYAQALYYLSICHIENGVIELNKLKDLFKKLPDETVAPIKKKLADDFSHLKIKGLIDESKIITNLNSGNPLLSTPARTETLQDILANANRPRF